MQPHVDLSKQGDGDEGKIRVKEKRDLFSIVGGHKFRLWVPVRMQYVEPDLSTAGACGTIFHRRLPYL